MILCLFVFSCVLTLVLLDMFRALRASTLPLSNVFSVTVGASSKQTLASWHLLEPADVISSIALLNGSANADDLGMVAAADDR